MVMRFFLIQKSDIAATLAENELANTYISEVGLYDADGDMVAMKAFLKKGKDADMECVFECDDTF